MGGQALNKFGIKTVRLNREDFLYIQKLTIKEFASIGIQLLEIPFYRHKDSFGDLDLLTEHGPDFKSLIKEFLNGDENIYVNDGVYSFGFPLDGGEKFQVDIITRKPEDLGIAQFYFSYNDLHNLIGRTAHHMGLKHGHCGLEFPIRQKLFDSNIDDTSDHVIKTLNLSKNPPEILEFLGYDWNRYCAGFDTLEDVFLYASSTPYFNADNFKLENLNHINRIRNRKRKVFMEFLKWLEDNPKHNKNYQFGKKRDWIDAIDKQWPIKDQIDFYNKKFIRNRENSLKFNGNIVRELTGLEGKNLGNILNQFKEYRVRSLFSDYNNFENYLSCVSAERIQKEFLEWYNKSI